MCDIELGSWHLGPDLVPSSMRAQIGTHMADRPCSKALAMHDASYVTAGMLVLFWVLESRAYEAFVLCRGSRVCWAH